MKGKCNMLPSGLITYKLFDTSQRKGWLCTYTWVPRSKITQRKFNKRLLKAVIKRGITDFKDKKLHDLNRKPSTKPLLITNIYTQKVALIPQSCLLQILASLSTFITNIKDNISQEQHNLFSPMLGSWNYVWSYLSINMSDLTPRWTFFSFHSLLIKRINHPCYK